MFPIKLVQTATFRVFLTFLLMSLLPAVALAQPRAEASAAYPDWVCHSEYLTLNDGTKIAIDIYRPANGGKVESRPLPVVWEHTPYQRGYRLKNGEHSGSGMPALAPMLLKKGYVVVSAEQRGTGASFGVHAMPWDAIVADDAFEITEWLADQSWSDGNIGMVGGSYPGINQYHALRKPSPHLKAVVPIAALVDTYSLFYNGGVLRDAFARNWGDIIFAMVNGNELKFNDGKINLGVQPSMHDRAGQDY